MTFYSTGLSCYNNAFFLFIFLQRLKIFTVEYGMYKHSVLQERQLASKHVILQRQTGMWTWDREGRFLWTNVADTGPAHGSEATQRVSRISRGYKRPMKCCLLKGRSHKIMHSSLLSTEIAALGFVPGSTDEPFILLSKQENYGSLRGKGLGLSLTFYQSC